MLCSRGGHFHPPPTKYPLKSVHPEGSPTVLFRKLFFEAEISAPHTSQNRLLKAQVNGQSLCPERNTLGTRTRRRYSVLRGVLGGTSDLWGPPLSKAVAREPRLPGPLLGPQPSGPVLWASALPPPPSRLAGAWWWSGRHL